MRTFAANSRNMSECVCSFGNNFGYFLEEFVPPTVILHQFILKTVLNKHLDDLFFTCLIHLRKGRPCINTATDKKG